MAVTVSAAPRLPREGPRRASRSRSARCTERGLEHDRRWMVVGRERRFPDAARASRAWPRSGPSSRAATLELSAPDAGECRGAPRAPGPRPRCRCASGQRVRGAARLARGRSLALRATSGLACRLVYMPREHAPRTPTRATPVSQRLVGFADGYAYLVAAEASLADLNARLAARRHPALPMNRFRPNLVVAGGERRTPRTAGRRSASADAALRVAKPCGRCQVTTTDQATGEVDGPGAAGHARHVPAERGVRRDVRR